MRAIRRLQFALAGALFSIGLVVHCATAFADDKPTRPMTSFSQAKKVARDTIYADRSFEFYCNCKFTFNPTGSGGTVDPKTCGYKPRSNAARGKQLEWEHVVPAAWFGQTRACWKSGHDQCTRDSGPYKGRACCSKVSKAFREAEADLHNLVPSVGELNADRSNLRYGLVDGEGRQYGRCDFEIGGSPKVTEPRPVTRGEVARIWFYMRDTYGVKVTAEERVMFQKWSDDDPPDTWERLRNDRIAAAQGNRNPYVK